MRSDYSKFVWKRVFDVLISMDKDHEMYHNILTTFLEDTINEPSCYDKKKSVKVIHTCVPTESMTFVEFHVDYDMLTK
jgi:hypothetical protein